MPDVNHCENYLSQDAALLYLNTSITAHYIGLLSQSLFLARLVALRSMCAQKDHTRAIVDHILAVEEWQISDEWIESATVGKEPQSENKPAESIIQEQKDSDGKIWLRFMPSGATGLSRWVFHQQDDDYFPSVPHGHLNGCSQPKLDSYLGWIYKGSMQICREPRRKIIALWNDKQFRKFATAAINYYHKKYPHYNWRVEKFLHLPRCR